MCLCQTIICQTTPLWVGVGVPLKGMDVPTVNHPMERSILGQKKMMVWTDSPNAEVEGKLSLLSAPGFDLVGTGDRDCLGVFQW